MIWIYGIGAMIVVGAVAVWAVNAYERDVEQSDRKRRHDEMYDDIERRGE